MTRLQRIRLQAGEDYPAIFSRYMIKILFLSGVLLYIHVIGFGLFPQPWLRGRDAVF